MIWSKGTQFTCFTGTKQHDLLYWYNSTTLGRGMIWLKGTPFSCFTGTKVQILTLEKRDLVERRTVEHFESVYLLTSTKVQILTQEEERRLIALGACRGLSTLKLQGNSIGRASARKLQDSSPACCISFDY